MVISKNQSGETEWDLERMSILKPYIYMCTATDYDVNLPAWMKKIDYRIEEMEVVLKQQSKKN